MPFLRYVDDPEFDSIGSVLECVEQLLEVRNTLPHDVPKLRFQSAGRVWYSCTNMAWHIGEYCEAILLKEDYKAPPQRLCIQECHDGRLGHVSSRVSPSHKLISPR